MWKQTEKAEEPNYKKGCDHEVCSECNHLIKKGSGQRVIEVYPSYPLYMYIPMRGEREVIFCELHKKPYDKFNTAWARYQQTETTYEKRVEPWVRVNADGSTYKKK